MTAQVLDAVSFAGGTAAAGLLEAVEILRELNATGARRVPDGALEGFVPARWRGDLDTARKSGSTSAYRDYWELCTLLGLRDGLRTGEVHVPGSRRYSGPATYLLTPDKWLGQRAEFCRLVGKPAHPDRALAVTEVDPSDLGEHLQRLVVVGDQHRHRQIDLLADKPESSTPSPIFRTGAASPVTSAAGTHSTTTSVPSQACSPTTNTTSPTGQPYTPCRPEKPCDTTRSDESRPLTTEVS
ncbi:hypothetical protein [Crossiella cryophila]|uniref:Uncharacterized protein n=1 Tax=Crossiella cryophila TaxID=43355 RepID=A0A7W7FWY0_9PSEU|nr:hypothetical protein [Crossiella cryophila]MBB4680063.1 hypothetical protein [Crossiella cryophila]